FLLKLIIEFIFVFSFNASRGFWIEFFSKDCSSLMAVLISSIISSIASCTSLGISSVLLVGSTWVVVLFWLAEFSLLVGLLF
ncbi:hypothetical protein, partial [Campylobacter porcelli]|nr:hypothetical protein [Campylobacter sp. CX2-4855-23]